MLRYFVLVCALLLPGQWLLGQEAKAVFWERDALSGGDWKGNLGKIGYSIPGFETLLRETIQLEWGENVHNYIWELETEDSNALQKTGTARVLACRFAAQGPVTFTLDAGPQPRKVTLYFYDGDHKNRSQGIRFYDESGQLLDEIVLGSFDTGVRLSWLIQGKVAVKILPEQGSPNAVINAVFIDEIDTGIVVPEKKSPASSTRKKIRFLAGTKSHGYGGHEHNAGALYLAELLETVADVDCIVYLDCKPGRLPDFDDADCVVVYSDGLGGWPLIGKSEQLETMKNRGCGFVFLHYATLPNQRYENQRVISGPEFEFVKQATGAVYELFWSVNPFYTAHFTSFVDHPITRGVKPFSLFDEWYFHLRFLHDLSTEEILEKGVFSQVVPILVCIPPDEVKSEPDGEHSGNPTVRNRKGLSEIVACAVQREDGGRGFLFTGGDVHWNFRHPDYRNILVNGILWTTGVEIPESGFHTPNPTVEQLEKNQDDPKPGDWPGHIIFSLEY